MKLDQNNLGSDMYKDVSPREIGDLTIAAQASKGVEESLIIQ